MLNNPTIEEIVDSAYDLQAEERLEVRNFGKENALTLAIYKDEEYDADTDSMNLVDVHTSMGGEYVDDACGVHCSDLWGELERLYNHKDFQLC